MRSLSRMILPCAFLAACGRPEPKRSAGTSASSRIDSTSPTGTRPDSATRPTVPDTSPAWQVTVAGAGPIRVGMTLTEAAAAMHSALPDTSKLDRACAYVRFDSLPDGLSLMWVDGLIVRVDVSKPTIATQEGARVGDSESRIRTLYDGRFSEQPHKYVKGGRYLIVSAPMAGDGSLHLVFESDGTHIAHYRAGREPQVEWVEGCA